MSSLFAAAAGVWDEFIGAAAEACEGLLARVGGKRRVIVEEVGEGRFEAFVDGKRGPEPLGSLVAGPEGLVASDETRVGAAIRGARVDLLLSPRRFFVRDLPLPAQAAAFLDQILRNQIDKLTPWTSEQALFGHVTREASATRLLVAIAAADRRTVMPTIDMVSALKPASLDVFAGPAGATGRVPLTTAAGGVVRRKSLRGPLGAALIAVYLAAAGYAAYAAYAKSGLDDRFETARSELARRRAALLAVNPLGGDEERLFQRKLQGPVATFTLEELSSLLPDDTYVTDIEVDGDKVRVGGVSRDATALIGLIEKSPLLSNAGFFAPTTKSASEPGERFHIEATARPREWTPK
jgi:general secretion pathway protein L